MQVILKEDVANLGYKDDVVTVKSGYGRNYLIPQGKAVIASPSALKVREEDLKQRAHKLEKIKADALALAAALEHHHAFKRVDVERLPGAGVSDQIFVVVVEINHLFLR